MRKKFPALGVCYYPEHWDRDVWEDDAQRMVACGISYVRIAEFAWSRFERSRDEFDFDWLDSIIDVLSAVDLKIILCTPTATPPKWLVDEMPDMVAVDSNGNQRKWGSRRHYDFSHLGYRKEAARITEILAKRYGRNPAVVAWQTDNEYGCHDTTISFSSAALDGFRNWLAQKYQSPDALNRAWGNVFWSMEVRDFNEIELPLQTVTEPNPSHILDFRRYTSDQVVAFNSTQTEILRKHSPNRDLIHNFMGRYLEFDHHDVSRDLDIASWDSYPIGFLEQFGKDEAWKNWYMRAGDPDFQAFHHDLYRGCTADKRMWVMEQQPGPVNWAPFNPDPHPGMVRLWSHEAFAHGAEVVSYFRWRQAPFAQEQFHTALNLVNGEPDRAFHEAQQVAQELVQLPEVGPHQARIAMVFDYPSIWGVEIQPQGASYDAFKLTFEFYSTLRRLGQTIDILPPNSDFEGYDLVVVPQLLMPDQSFVERVQPSSARFIFGPRCGSRTATHHIPNNLAPGILQDVLPIKVTRVESLRPSVQIPVGHSGSFERWFEHLEPGEYAHVKLTTDSGLPAWVAADSRSYIAGWPDDELLIQILREELKAANIQVTETGDDLRITDRGGLRTIVNYGPNSHEAGDLIDPNDEVLIGSKTLDVAGVTIVKRVRK